MVIDHRFMELGMGLHDRFPWTFVLPRLSGIVPLAHLLSVALFSYGGVIFVASNLFCFLQVCVCVCMCVCLACLV